MTKETVKTEICSHCKKSDFQVHHYLRDGHHDRIFLECSACGELASRLIVHAQVAPNSYSSFLQKVAKLGDMDPRNILESYKLHESRAIKQFCHVKKLINDLRNNNDTHKESVTSLYNLYNIIEDNQD